MIIDPKIFRDYDIRAVVPTELDEEGLRRITQAIIYHLKPKSIQVGHDMRVTSPQFHNAFIEEAVSLGVDIVDLGLTSTDMLYYAAGKYPEDIAVNISASHNPPEYNGMKIVKKGAVPVSGRNGIYDIRDLAVSDKNLKNLSEIKGKITKRVFLDEYVNKVLSFIDLEKMKPISVVSDTGNGMAGHYMPSFESKLPWNVTRLYYELDGTFPNHTPSPIEEKNRIDCINKVKELKADVGLTFDGDGDRVFMIDELGRTLSGTVITAIIAENLLKKHHGEKILYNAVVGRIVPEVIKKNDGIPVRVRVGHTLIKEDMRKHNGLFCGEHSGHFFFRDFYFADSAVIAALLVIELMSTRNMKLSELLDEFDKYPGTGRTNEINFITDDKETIMKSIESEYSDQAESIDWLDGISVWFKDWWFNIRPSNTEPLLRLNVEADNDLIYEQNLKMLINKIEKLGGKEKV